MRAFLALDLPRGTKDALTRLRAELPVGRPVPAENLHLTLAFLGEQPEAVLSDLHDELESVRALRFDLGISGLGCFGSRSPKILFAAVSPDPGLGDLRRKIVGAARRAGIALARERFRPHVTLARFGKGLPAFEAARLGGLMQAHAGLTVPPQTVAGYSLVRSILRPQGALHEELARYRLW
ncbi:MAG: RNA 2',3'-cyclic phosphodiesterase [Jhaorihella sp.]